MNIWQYLLSVRSSEAQSFAGVEATWRLWLPVVWTLLTVLVAGFVVALFYFLEPRRIAGRRRWTLIALRLAAVLLLAVVLFRPLQPTAIFKGERPRGVAVLMDTSQSMGLKDRRITTADKLRVALAFGLVPPGTPVEGENARKDAPTGIPENPARLDLARAILEHPDLRLLENAAQVGPLRLATFGTRPRRVTPKEGMSPTTALLTELNANDPATALADAIDEALFRGEGDPPAAIVVVTDGLEHDSKHALADVAAEAGRLGVPIHFVALGSRDAGLVQLREAPVPDLLFLDDAVAVPFRYRVQGQRGTVKLEVLLGKEVLASKDVPAVPGEEIREVVSFTPTKDKLGAESMHLLTTRVTLKENPALTDELQRAVRVVDQKIKVLVVENIARWDFQFLQRALMRDRRVEASFVILQGDKETLTSGKPFLPAFPASRKELFGYDLLILGDVPASAIGPEAMGWVREFVQEGGGLVTIAGRIHAPATWRGTPLEAMLPVEFEPRTFSRTGETRNPGFLPERTRQGKQSQMLSLGENADDNDKVWAELPGIFWHYPVTRLKPGAVALLAHPTQKADDEPMPLLAQHYFGKGQVLFVGFEESWRWRFNRSDALFSRFWGQVVYQMGLRGSLGSLRTQLSLDRAQATYGRLGKAYARLLDANLKPLTQKTVSAVLEHLDAKPGEPRARTVELQLVPGTEGEYQLNLVHDKEGRFALKLGGDEPARIDYRVEVPPRHEKAPLPLPVRTLSEAAQASGGGVYREEDLHRLAESIQPRKAEFTERVSIPLLNPLTFLLFLGLITTEWVVRKFTNLS